MQRIFKSKAILFLSKLCHVVPIEAELYATFEKILAFCFFFFFFSLQNIMGNAESAVVQKRLTRFRPEERPVIDGVFNKLVSGGGGASEAPGKAITLQMLQVGQTGTGSSRLRIKAPLLSVDISSLHCV